MRWTELPEFSNCPPDWEVVKLLSKADFVAGQSPASELYNTRADGAPFLQGNADFGRISPTPLVSCTAPTKFCDAGDTLISVRAPVGALNRADQVYGLGRGVGALHPTNIDADYLYHAMARWHIPLLRAAQGSTFDAVTARHFRQLRCCLPISGGEQKAIAERLNLADEAITAAEAKLAAAQRLKTALMQQLFTRGVPGRHTRFQQTKVGEIPKGWELLPLGKLATIVSGIALNTDRAPQLNPHQYLTVIHVQRERLDLAEVRYLEVFPNELPDALLEEGDILVVEGHANAAEIGRAALATREVSGFAYQNHIFRIRLLPDAKLDRLFLLGVLNSERIRRHWVATCNTSSGLNTINRRALRKLLIQRPPTDEQEEMAELLSTANETINACESELQAINRLKRSLLQNLLIGRVRVRVES
jgi:type I restriction enzyme S subunit